MKDKELLQEKLIDKLYDFWKQDKEEEYNNTLLEQLNDEIKNKGINGAETLLDWCRDDFDECRKTYMEIHSLDEDEMEKIMEDNLGDYTFMYEEVPYASELDEIWDLCNYYLDYCNEETDLNLNNVLSFIYNI